MNETNTQRASKRECAIHSEWCGGRKKPNKRIYTRIKMKVKVDESEGETDWVNEWARGKEQMEVVQDNNRNNNSNNNNEKKKEWK